MFLKSIAFTLISCQILLFGCNEEPSYIEGEFGDAADTGEALFWTASATLGGSYIEIFVEDFSVGTITEYYEGSSPDCSSENVTFLNSPGNYLWTGKGQDGTNFSGDVTITANTCVKVEITSAAISYQPPAGTTYAIQNVWTNNYLNVSAGQITCSNVSTSLSTAQWVITMVPNAGFVTVMNKGTNTFLSMDNASLLSSIVQSGKSQWILETYSTGIHRFKNNDGGANYLNIETGSVSSTTILDGWLSAQWRLIPK